MDDTARREQQWQQVRAGLAKLDGTRRSRVALRTGLSPERLDELGGVGEVETHGPRTV